MRQLLENRLLLAACLILLAGLLAALGGERPLFLERLERQAFDWRMARVEHPENQPRIIVVRAGEESFRRLGEWPWPRAYHAALLEKLGPARLVALDILFPEHSDPGDDALLAGVVAELGDVITAMHLAPDPDRAQGILMPPYPALADAALDLGVTNVEEDVDGLIRGHTPVRLLDDKAYPSLALATAARYLDVTPDVVFDHGHVMLRLGEREIELTESASMWMDYSGPPILSYEYEQVLSGLFDPEIFRDAIVVVGISASGADDFHVVPDGLGKRVLPGTDYNALAMRTLLTGHVPWRISPMASTAVVFLLSLLGLACALPRRPGLTLAALATCALAFGTANFALFTRLEIWVDFAFPLAAMIILFLATSFARHYRLHHDWSLKSYSLASLYDLESAGRDHETLGSYLTAIWPRLQANTGVRLLAAESELDRLRSDIREAVRARKEEPGGTPQALIIRTKEGQTPYIMALPVALPEDGPPGWVVLGWKRRIKEDTVRTLATTVLSAAWFFRALARGRERRKLLTDTIHAIFRAVDYRDPITGGHSDRVATLAQEIAAEMDLAEEEREDIHLGALIHDIGKIGIPDAVLGKPDRLTGDEFGMILKHPAIGEEIMRPVQLPELARRTLAEHHERHDGSGYPHGISGKDTSLGARIVAVADVFDALRSDRPYRKGLPPDRVCDYIYMGAGKSFDPHVVETLLRIKAPQGWKPPDEEAPGDKEKTNDH